ncbi:hypothetical protein B0O99DRAFT_709471 [Bisporella sp. PMI_857]|nr:hypothetical protein B0O99DRAFT_709471 [Bisporella sp. PMI_857]
MMKMQLEQCLNKTVVQDKVEPLVEHQLIERTQLHRIISGPSKGMCPEAIVAQKVSAINHMNALASQQEAQTPKPRSAPASRDPIKEETPVLALDLSPPPRKFPLVCEKTRCIFCIGNVRLSYEQRTRTFTRVSHMMGHVENLHLREVLKGYLPPPCP